ncbi:thiamine phosphate synthase [Lentilactobacillus curieae]|uniref:Thiamine-phosphate synthase n=1 Tax=Lentilactobacillus curieae TaxID=1138822 RepID=A0A1S6QGR1_9LACO|nr:thiamine phosphate synthase [Lentilactobacillus curieae]AQW20790.1 thiamine phosphate synthase [Lentilactobacillus curieae]
MTIKFESKHLGAYFICGTQDIKNENQTIVSVLTEALNAGITAFQFREKGPTSLTGEAKYKLAVTLKKLCKDFNVPFIVDDDVALAKRVGADGIHVGQKDQKVGQVITEVGDQIFVGLSCDTKEQVEEANQLSGLAYIGSGPAFTTQSKADADPVIGPEEIAKLVKLSDYPVVAIGGITEDNVTELAGTGVAGVSVISVIAQSDNINRTVSELKTVKY